MIGKERWQRVSLRDQIGHIASEIKRAEFVSEEKTRKSCLERALFLIDLCLEGERWCLNSLTLLTLRDEVAKSYIGGISDL